MTRACRSLFSLHPLSCSAGCGRCYGHACIRPGTLSSRVGSSVSNGDVVVYLDVLLFRSYISAASDYAYSVLQHVTASEVFNGLTIILHAHWSQ